MYKEVLLNLPPIPDSATLSTHCFIRAWLARTTSEIVVNGYNIDDLNKHIRNNFYNIGKQRIKHFSREELMYFAIKLTCQVFEWLESMKQVKHVHMEKEMLHIRNLILEIVDMSIPDLQKYVLKKKSDKQQEYAKLKHESKTDSLSHTDEDNHKQSTFDTVTTDQSDYDDHGDHGNHSPRVTCLDKHADVMPYGTKLVFWNTLKMSFLDEQLTARQLNSQLGGLTIWLNEHDFIALTEITSGVGRRRVARLIDVLNSLSLEGQTWKWMVVYSEESCASTSERGIQEIHAILFRSSWKLCQSKTLHRIESGGSTIRMGHAPLVAHFQLNSPPSLPSSPSSVACELLQELSIIVAHLAPSTRARTRNQEAKALFRRYAELQELRFTSFESNSHILCGDFNMHPESPDGIHDISLTKQLWTPYITTHQPTMATSDHTYDNVLCNRWLTSKHFISAHVQPLRRLPNGKPLSDHYPVSLTLVHKDHL